MLRRLLLPSATLAFLSLTAASSGCFLLNGDDEKSEAPAKEKPADIKKPVEKKPVAIVVPDYAPTGDDAEMKKEAAKDITQKNALDAAKALEADLDKAIADLEGK